MPQPSGHLFGLEVAAEEWPDARRVAPRRFVDPVFEARQVEAVPEYYRADSSRLSALQSSLRGPCSRWSDWKICMLWGLS